MSDLDTIIERAEKRAVERRKAADLELADNPYAQGLGPLAERGELTPRNGRLLLRAVLPGDYSSIAGLVVANREARQAICHEVVDAASDVPERESWLGRHCIHLDAAADPIDGDGGRWVFVHHEDILCDWIAPERT